LETKEIIEEQSKLLLPEYTSQVLAHAGYTITLGFGFFALLSPIANSFSFSVHSRVDSSLQIILVFAILLLAFYSFCRSFYYNELWNIVKSTLDLGGKSVQQYYLEVILEYEKRKCQVGMSIISVSEIMFRIFHSEETNAYTYKGFRKYLLKFATYHKESLSGEDSKVWTVARKFVESKHR